MLKTTIPIPASIEITSPRFTSKPPTIQTIAIIINGCHQATLKNNKIIRAMKEIIPIMLKVENRIEIVLLAPLKLEANTMATAEHKPAKVIKK